MKRLQVLFLVAFSSTLLLFGCGKKEEVIAEPVVEQVIDDIEEPEIVEEAEETETTDIAEDVPP